MMENGLIRLTVLSCVLFFSLGLYSQQRKEIVVYIHKYKDIAVKEMERVGIPASITMAQGILESGYGKSTLSVKSNNHFGIKCHSSWTGAKTYHDDDRRGECFRVYDHPNASYVNHSKFLTSNSRYGFLFRLPKDDYASWAYGLQEAGYATSKTYASKLIELIERYDLDKLDSRRYVGMGDKNSFFATDAELQQGASSSSRGSSDRVMVHPNRVKFVYAKSGDTFESLSKRFSISVDDIMNYNDFTYSKPLKKGNIVFLQKKRMRGHRELYVSKSGDTMHRVAQKFAIQVAYLYKRNDMKPGANLRAGTTLNLRS